MDSVDFWLSAESRRTLPDLASYHLQRHDGPRTPHAKEIVSFANEISIGPWSNRPNANYLSSAPNENGPKTSGALGHFRAAPGPRINWHHGVPL